MHCFSSVDGASTKPLSASCTSGTFAVVIPLHNEEMTVPRLVQELACLRKLLEYRLAVILVDDASTDATRPLLRQWASDEWVTIVSTRERSGQHRALFVGLEAALRMNDVRVVGTMDADLDPSPTEFMTLLPYLDRHDLVIGRRLNRSRSPFRKGISLILNALSWLLRPSRIHDHGSMFRLYTPDLCQRCLLMRADGEFLAGVSLLTAFSPMEVPVHSAMIPVRPSRHAVRTIADSGLQMLRLLVHHPLGLRRHSGRSVTPARPETKGVRSGHCRPATCDHRSADFIGTLLRAVGRRPLS